MALLTPKDIREHTFQTVRFKEGYDVDEVDDFLDQVNGMTTALYHENGSLLYGENPIAAASRPLQVARRRSPFLPTSPSSTPRFPS